MNRYRKMKKIKVALEWARLNLPPHEYQIVYNSYRKLVSRTIIAVLLCLPVIFASVFILIFTPFSNKAESDNMPAGATTSREARVDYDGNFYWTYDSKKV